MTETVPLPRSSSVPGRQHRSSSSGSDQWKAAPTCGQTGRRGANTPHCQHFAPNSAHPSECSDAHADKTAAETLLKMQMALRRAVPVVNCPHPFFPVGLSCAYTQARPDGTGPWSAGPWAKGTGSAPAWMPCWQWQPCPVAEFWMTDTPPTTSHSERLSLCVHPRTLQGNGSPLVRWPGPRVQKDGDSTAGAMGAQTPCGEASPSYGGRWHGSRRAPE